MDKSMSDPYKCPICKNYLEKPVTLPCGYTLCFKCLQCLRREGDGESLVCPYCSRACEPKDVRFSTELAFLVTKIRELEAAVGSVMKNPNMRKLAVDLSLDVNTANNLLVISEDLKSVHCGFVRQNRRKHVGRFLKAMCVLGTPAFTSGRHYWEVDVGTADDWDLGVCEDSVERREVTVLSSHLGFWTIGQRKGKYMANTHPLTELRVKPGLQRVGVYLDMPFQSISFLNAATEDHIFTFTRISNLCKLHAFFSLVPAKDAQSVLRICPLVGTSDLVPVTTAPSQP